MFIFAHYHASFTTINYWQHNFFYYIFQILTTKDVHTCSIFLLNLFSKSFMFILTYNVFDKEKISTCGDFGPVWVLQFKEKRYILSSTAWKVESYSSKCTGILWALQLTDLQWLLGRSAFRDSIWALQFGTGYRVPTSVSYLTCVDQGGILSSILASRMTQNP